jgi:hypothetical protein
MQFLKMVEQGEKNAQEKGHLKIEVKDLNFF